MKIYMIINGCSNDCKKQMRMQQAFARKAHLDLEKAHTIIICDREMDGDGKLKLAEMAPTKSVLFVVLKFYNPEIILDDLSRRVERDSLCIFGSGFSGQELSVRLGARMGGSSLIDVLSMEKQEDKYVAEKMVYSNHMKATYMLKNSPFCISICKSQEESRESYEQDHEVEECCVWNDSFEVKEPVKEYVEEKSSLEDCQFVVVVGRGAGNKEKTRQLQQLSEEMGAEFGISRPAAMNAWAPMDRLVGVSGVMIKPQICIAAGISGSPAFYAGIDKSRFIIAVNTDERAPLMKKSDIAVVGDCREILSELARCISKKTE